MGEEIFTFLRESKYSVSLITVPFCPVAPCPFQILAGVLEIHVSRDLGERMCLPLDPGGVEAGAGHRIEASIQPAI